MYFGHYNQEGKYIGFYVGEIHGDNIPEPHIVLTPEQHQEAMTGNYRVIDGQHTYSPLPEPSIEEQRAVMQKQLTDAVQKHMDAVAQSLGYDNLLSAVTYAEESAVPKFQAEGIAFRSWRSQVWDYCYAQLAAVLSEVREAPEAEELIAELPSLELPQ